MEKILQRAAGALITVMPVIIFSVSLCKGIYEQNAYIALKGLGLAALFGGCLWGNKK